MNTKSKFAKLGVLALLVAMTLTLAACSDDDGGTTKYQVSGTVTTPDNLDASVVEISLDEGADGSQDSKASVNEDGTWSATVKKGAVKLTPVAGEGYLVSSKTLNVDEDLENVNFDITDVENEEQVVSGINSEIEANDASGLRDELDRLAGLSTQQVGDSLTIELPDGYAQLSAAKRLKFVQLLLEDLAGTTITSLDEFNTKLQDTADKVEEEYGDMKDIPDAEEDEEEAVTVDSVSAINGTTLKLTLSDDTTEEVTLDTALEDGQEYVDFTYNEEPYTMKLDEPYMDPTKYPEANDTSVEETFQQDNGISDDMVIDTSQVTLNDRMIFDSKEYKVSWESQKPSIIDASTAEVNRPVGEDVEVTLTATLDYLAAANNTSSASKEFDITVTVKGKLGVEDISVLNSNQFKVLFSRDIDEETATTAANYKIDGENLTAADVEMDGTNAVVITANDGEFSGFKVGASYSLAVTTNVEDTTGEALAEEASDSFTYTDDVAPTVEGFEAIAGTNGTTDQVTVTYSEPVDTTTGTVKIDGSVATVDSQPEVNTVVYEVSDIAMEPNSTHDIVIANVEDNAENAVDPNPYSATFTVEEDADIPTAALTAETEDTILVEFSEKVNNVETTGNVIAKKGIQDVTDGITSVADKDNTWKIELDSSNLYANDATTVDITVEIDGVTDQNGNELTGYSEGVTLTKDETAPKAVEASYKGNKVIHITYDEAINDVALATTSIELINSEDVTLDVDTVELADTQDITGNDTVKVTTVNDLSVGDYDITILADVIEDSAIDANKNAKETLSFERENNVKYDTEKPTVDSGNVNGDVITVNFSEEVNSSALNYENYKIGGAVIPSDSNLVYKNTKDTVKIELPEEYFNKDTTKVFEVTNVADLSNNVMDKFVADVEVNDTRKPELVSAKLTDANKLTLAYDEEMTKSSFDSDTVTFYKDGEEATSISADSATANEDGEIVLSLNGLSDLTGGTYEVEFEGTTGLVDTSDLNNDMEDAKVEITDGIAPDLNTGGNTGTVTILDANENDLTASGDVDTVADSGFNVKIESVDTGVIKSATLVIDDETDVTDPVKVSANTITQTNSDPDAPVYTIEFAEKDVDLSSLAEGDIISAHVIATDQYNNTSSVDATEELVVLDTGSGSSEGGITLDRTASDAPTNVAGASGSGLESDDILNGSEVTSVQTLDVTLDSAAETTDTLTLYVDGTEVNTATASDSTDQTIDLPADTFAADGSDDGAHDITVTVTDEAGNESAASGAYTVTVDTIAPDALNDGTSFDADSGTETNGVTFTDNTTTTVDTLAFADLNSDVETVKVTIDGTEYTDTVSSGSVTLDIGDNTGTNSVDADVVYIDEAGNESTATTVTLKNSDKGTLK